MRLFWEVATRIWFFPLHSWILKPTRWFFFSEPHPWINLMLCLIIHYLCRIQKAIPRIIKIPCHDALTQSYFPTNPEMRRKSHGYSADPSQLLQRWPWQKCSYFRRINHFLWSIPRKGGFRRDLHVEKVMTWQKPGRIFCAQGGMGARDGNQGGYQQQNGGKEEQKQRLGWILEEFLVYCS